MPLVIGTAHPHTISKTVAKGTLRRQSAVEGGETRVTLVSVGRQSRSSGSKDHSEFDVFKENARQEQTAAQRDKMCQNVRPQQKSY